MACRSIGGPVKGRTCAGVRAHALSSSCKEVHALDTLRKVKCDRVVIIGLSLREADYQTRWLLRTALAAARPRDIEIDVVNLSSEDRNRLRGFFVGLGRVDPYESIDKFLDGRRHKSALRIPAQLLQGVPPNTFRQLRGRPTIPKARTSARISGKPHIVSAVWTRFELYKRAFDASPFW
jgi:hypothetical protein